MPVGRCNKCHKMEARMVLIYRLDPVAYVEYPDIYFLCKRCEQDQYNDLIAEEHNERIGRFLEEKLRRSLDEDEHQ